MANYNPGRRVKGVSSLSVQEKKARIVDLRRQGWSFDRIAEDIGNSASYAWKLWNRALKEIPVSSVEDYRTAELDKLDQWERQCNEILDGVHPVVSNGRVVHWQIWDADKGRYVDSPDQDLVDHGPRLAAFDRLLKIQDARRKLLGLDAPVKTDVAVSAVDPGSIELRALLEQRQTANDQERSQLAEEDRTR